MLFKRRVLSGNVSKVECDAEFSGACEGCRMCRIVGKVLKLTVI